MHGTRARKMTGNSNPPDMGPGLVSGSGPVDTIRGPASLGDRAVTLARRYGLFALRVALGIVFVWFGLLKLFEVSPASMLIDDLLTATVPAVPVRPVVVALGAVEVVIGLGFLSWIAPRVTLLLFLPQMTATFGTLVFLPGTVFQRGDPLLLSLSGEFVVKNLVLLAAGLAVLAAVPTRAERPGPSTRSTTTGEPTPIHDG